MQRITNSRLNICRRSKDNGKTTYTAYVDYKKAFDSISHTWLIELRKSTKSTPALLHTITGTNPKMDHQNNDIFQVDSLSSLWFCMVMNRLP